MIHDVVQVSPIQDYKVYVYFADGKIKLFDMSSFLGQGVFKQIADPVVFNNTCTVMNHTLAWDVGGNFDEYNCIDIAPDTIYESGIDVADPFAERVA